jgi:DNA-binding response OmpR family regulator
MTTNPTTKPNPGEELMRDARRPVSTSQAMKKNILVVDDDSQVRESLRKVLQAEGYEVRLAADGLEGLEQFDSKHIDLLLLDLNLPAKSGWDLFERFSSTNPLLPIIIITGRHNQYNLAAAAGVGALMEKPLDVPLLLQTIAALLIEPAEAQLKRLVGLHSDVRYAPPRRTASTTCPDPDSEVTHETPEKPSNPRCYSGWGINE